jgi:biopolymer transport protein ExbB/TolQ
MSFDLAHLWASMGTVAKAVAFTLVLMALLSLVVSIERVMVYNRATRQSLALAERLSQLLAQRDIEGAVAAAGEKDFQAAYLGTLVSNGLTAFLGRRGTRGADAVAAAKRAIDKSIQLEDMALRRGVAILANVSATAPFVGLFGTTFGIINAFQAMGASGAGGIGAVSAGIAEALITTAFGLFVAIPATWVFNYLTGRISIISTEMAVSTTELVDFCIGEQEKSAG